MSTSLKVVREAAVFWDCLSRSAMRSLIRFILTRCSPRSPRAAGASLAGFGGGAGAFFSGAEGGGAGLLSSCLGSGFDSGSGLDSGFFSSSLSLDSALGADSPAPSGGAPPSSNRMRSWPTVTVSSSFARNSLIVPASGALTATSI